LNGEIIIVNHIILARPLHVRDHDSMKWQKETVMPIKIDDKLANAALQAAAKAGWASVAKGLIEAGANPNADNGIALAIAKRYGDPETIKLLEEKTTIGKIVPPMLN
jgi:ankyrin repeat protein